MLPTWRSIPLPRRVVGGRHQDGYWSVVLVEALMSMLMVKLGVTAFGWSIQGVTEFGLVLTCVTEFGTGVTGLVLSRLLVTKIAIAACALGSLGGAVTEIGRPVTGFA